MIIHPFMPTVFEHAASFLGITPSKAAQDPYLMSKCQIMAWEEYLHSAVSVGIDVYNIEAEALGSIVTY